MKAKGKAKQVLARPALISEGGTGAWKREGNSRWWNVQEGNRPSSTAGSLSGSRFFDGVWTSMRTTFSVLLMALLEKFQWGRAGDAGVQSLAFTVYTCAAPAAGALIGRAGPRRVILPRIVPLSAGLSLSSRIQSQAQFNGFYGLIVALGVTCVSIVAYSAILAR
jgi:hypothetical protein